jgi:peroxiredoxin
LAAIVTVTAFLVVACGAGGSAAAVSSTNGNSGPAVPAESEKNDREPAGDFELVLFETSDHQRGEKIRLSQFAGNPVVLNFWFPSCPPCVAEMPDLESAYQKFKSEGVEFIGVQLLGLDTAGDGQEFVDDIGVNYMIGADQSEDSSGDITREYAVRGFPTTVFIDSDQRIARKWSGILNLEKIEELVEGILN